MSRFARAIGRSLVRQDIEADFKRLEGLVADLEKVHSNASPTAGDLKSQIEDLKSSLASKSYGGATYYYYSRLQNVNVRIIEAAPLSWLYEIWRSLDLRVSTLGKFEGEDSLKETRANLDAAFRSLGYAPLPQGDKSFECKVDGHEQLRAIEVIRGSLISIRKQLDLQSLSGVWQAMAINEALLSIILWMSFLVVGISGIFVAIHGYGWSKELTAFSLCVLSGMFGAAISSVSTIAFDQGGGLPLISKPRHVTLRLLIGAIAGVFVYFLWASQLVKIGANSTVDPSNTSTVDPSNTIWFVLAFGLGFSERIFANTLNQVASALEQRVQAAVGASSGSEKQPEKAPKKK